MQHEHMCPEGKCKETKANYIMCDKQTKCSEDDLVQICFYLFCLYLDLIVNSMSCRQVIKGEAGCSIPA